MTNDEHKDRLTCVVEAHALHPLPSPRFWFTLVHSEMLPRCIAYTYLLDKLLRPDPCASGHGDRPSG